MGQSSSTEGEAITREELTRRLTRRMAKRCFTEIEYYSFRDVFSSLAEQSDGINYWSEDTLTRFLELPDALDVGALIYHSTAFVGAFPFLSDGPSILDFEAMVRVVSVFTGRYKGVLKKGGGDGVRLWFRAFSVYDRGVVEGGDDKQGGDVDGESGHTTKPPEVGDNDLFQIADPEDLEDDDDDEFALAALDALDSIEVFKHAEKVEIKFIRKIDPEDMTKLVMLLLVVSGMDPQESLAIYADRYSAEALPELRKTAESIVRSMSSNGRPILWSAFSKSIRRSLPFLFHGLRPLYEHFLFSKRLSNRRRSSAAVPSSPTSPTLPPPSLLPSESNILTPTTLTQLKFFLPPSINPAALHPLYLGSTAGFSMGSFETKVLKWRAPSILIVTGTRLPATPDTSRHKSFADSLAPKRYPDSIDTDGTVVFGAYIDVPWKLSHKEPFGDAKTQLFQLYPIHEVFETSRAHTDYIYFNKSAGIGFGSPLPKVKTGEPVLRMNLGAVSLVLDDALEFGVFTHASAGGGAFHCSDLPEGAVPGRKGDWQERFEVDELEVWGVGGEAEAKDQARRWAWDEAEAMRRRNVQLGDDVEANRALLEMAGIIGGGRSGGSV